MHTLQSLINIANKFLTDRNWWQFHNPKNDATNILVEVSELVEHFIDDEITDETFAGIKDEMADVLLATIVFCMSNSIDLMQAINMLFNQHIFKDTQISYAEFQDTIISHKNVLPMHTLKKPQQVALSLLMHARKITDLFIWCSEDYSKQRAQEKHDFIMHHIAQIIAHLAYLSSIMNIDLATEYIRKMKHNMERYPVDTSTGEKYMAIKDKHRVKK